MTDRELDELLEYLASQEDLTGEVEQEELAKYEDTIRQNNPDYYVRAEIIDNRIVVVTLICKKCGFIVKKVRANKNFTITECEGCARKLTDKSYRGTCQLNHVGRIYNGMEIIEQYTDPEKGYLCDIKCAVCGRPDSIKKGVYLIDVIRRKYYHDCEYPVIDYRCKSCNNILELPIKAILNGCKIQCPKCHADVDKTDLNFELNTYDMKLSFNRVRKTIDGERPDSKMIASANNTLFYDEIPVYRSNNENYYRCICTKHNSRLTLSETEISNYNCEKCSDVNEEMFKKLKPSNIRIKGEKRIKPKE